MSFILKHGLMKILFIINYFFINLIKYFLRKLQFSSKSLSGITFVSFSEKKNLPESGINPFKFFRDIALAQFPPNIPRN